jgi:glutaminase
MDFPSIAEQSDRPYILTGHLPEPEMVQSLVSDAHRQFQTNSDGNSSQVCPALLRLPEVYSARSADR